MSCQASSTLVKQAQYCMKNNLFLQNYHDRIYYHYFLAPVVFFSLKGLTDHSQFKNVIYNCYNTVKLMILDE